MTNYPGGWLSLENSSPMPITDIITFASVNDGSVTKGVVLDSSTYHDPTGGTWAATPISITNAPTFNPVNPTYSLDDVMVADAMNMQTKSANLTTAPSSLSSLIYLYGNNSDIRFSCDIVLSLGGLSYDSIQISVLENCVTYGDSNGNIQVIDFGAGPYTGAVTLNLILGQRFGPINIGIRLESTTNVSSIFELQTVILPPPAK
jgi:hypothetical protein